MSVGGYACKGLLSCCMGFQATWETWSLGVTLGCKCLFMCEVGERAGGVLVGPSVAFVEGVWLSLTPLVGKSSAETTGFPAAEGSALSIVFGPKKKRKGQQEGPRRHPVSDT